MAGRPATRRGCTQGTRGRRCGRKASPLSAQGPCREGCPGSQLPFSDNSKESHLDGGEDEGVEAEVPCKTKIAKLGSTVAVEQNVLWFDVPGDIILIWFDVPERL